jgi:hypothetical protein
MGNPYDGFDEGRSGNQSTDNYGRFKLPGSTSPTLLPSNHRFAVPQEVQTPGLGQPQAKSTNSDEG